MNIRDLSFVLLMTLFGTTLLFNRITSLTQEINQIAQRSQTPRTRSIMGFSTFNQRLTHRLTTHLVAEIARETRSDSLELNGPTRRLYVGSQTRGT